MEWNEIFDISNQNSLLLSTSIGGSRPGEGKGGGGVQHIFFKNKDSKKQQQQQKEHKKRKNEGGGCTHS